MKKETVIAIFFGVMFGAVVAVFLLAKNKEFQLTKSNTIVPTSKLNKISKNSGINLKSLNISEPQDGTVINSKTITLKGKTEIGTLIIIQTQIKDIIIKTEKPDFSIAVPLALGENVIKITAHFNDSQSRPQEKNIRIYNLDEEL